MTASRGNFTIIRASAGSGKTYRLMELLAQRLARKDNPLEPSQIIATTFTRKAAGELSERIQLRLLDEVAAADEELKPQLRKQILGLPSALIGTVNSVTDHILRTYAVDAQLSPELTVLSEDTQKRAFNLATAPIFAQFEAQYSDLLARMEYDALPNRDFGNAQSFSTVVNHIITKARAENLTPAQLPGLAEKSKAELATAFGDVEDVDLRAKVHSFLTDFEAVVESSGDKDSGLKTKLLEAYRSTFPVLNPANPREPWKTWMSPLGSSPKICGANLPAKTKRLVIEHFSGITAYAVKEFREDVDQLIDITYAAAAQCMEAYAEHKRVFSQIDFVDQERLTLELIQNNARVQQEIAKQFSILIVDEFQDTSPIQLALFMELAKWVEEVIWVGDPKQSIYRFRGADPTLMTAAVTALAPGSGADDSNVLKQSWRTHEVPLSLSNHLFAPLFPDDAAAVLSIPEEKKEAHRGGSVQWWSPAQATGRNGSTFTKDDTFGALGFGLRTALDNEGPLERGRAILTRTNSEVNNIIAQLRQWGIVCEGTANPVIETREGTALSAALTLLVDRFDTQALVELISIMPTHPAHGSWFTQLAAAQSRESREQLLEQWREDEVFAPLYATSGMLGTSALPDVVSAAISALNLPRVARGWTNPEQRLTNLESLVDAASEYSTVMHGEAGEFSVPGFLSYLEGSFTQEGPRARAAAHKDAVTVMTIHRAKGLEWDSVILPLFAPRDNYAPVGVWVDPAQEFDVFNPLSGRSLMFWPHTLLSASARDELMATEAHHFQHAASREEDIRVAYVAFTRSRKETIVLAHASASSVLTRLAEDRAITRENFDTAKAKDVAAFTPAEPQDNALRIHSPHSVVDGKTGEPTKCPGCEDCIAAAVGMTSFFWPIHPEDYPGGIQSSLTSPLAAKFADGSEDGQTLVAYPPATFTASGTEAQDIAATITALPALGPRLVAAGNQGWDHVGSAIHAYLGVDRSAFTDAEKAELAQSLIARWGVAKHLDTDAFIRMAAAWDSWVTHTFGADATVQTEVPFALARADGARAQGWMDTIIIDSSGTWHVVDHKSYPGAEPEEHIRTENLGQMAVYKEAVEAAGHRLGGIYMHMPLLGQVFEVRFP